MTHRIYRGTVQRLWGVGVEVRLDAPWGNEFVFPVPDATSYRFEVGDRVVIWHNAIGENDHRPVALGVVFVADWLVKESDLSDKQALMVDEAVDRAAREIGQ